MADAICPCGAAIEQAKCGPRKNLCSACSAERRRRSRRGSGKFANEPRRPCVQCHGPTGYRLSDTRTTSPVCLKCRRQTHGKSGRAEKQICCASCSNVFTVRADNKTRFCRSCAGLGQRQRVNREKVCVHCCTSFWSRTRETRYCARCFRLQVWKSRNRDLVIYTGPTFVRKPRINENPIPLSNRKFKSGSCKVCGSSFLTLYTDVTCSAECQRVRAAEARQVGGAKRRARKRDAFVADVWRSRIFKADGYRCHLCNRKCKRATTYLKGGQVLHPLSPTIDHLIPLAKGGTHEPANCRTACYKCNTKKSDGGGGDQFAIAI